MKLLGDKVGVDWSNAIEGLFGWENRAFTYSCSGPDGKLGFGGSCFPKDVQR